MKLKITLDARISFVRHKQHKKRIPYDVCVYVNNKQIFIHEVTE